MRSRLSTITVTFLAVLACIAVSPVLPAAAAGLTAPPDPRFGIVEAYTNAQAATEAGAGYTRIILRWDVIQPAGPVDWKPANVPDPFIEDELRAGRQVVGLLIGTPAWAAVEPGQGAPAVPKMEYWAAFVKRMAEQYHGRIVHWIIWNEPDVWEVDHPGHTWAGSEQDYAQLLKTAYLAIKGVDPGLQVHLAGLTYFWDQQHGRRQYLDRLLDAIVTDPEAAAHAYYFDGVVYHLYFNPLQAPAIIGLAQTSLRGHGIPAKPIWINETNAPPSEDAQELPWSEPRFRITLDEQAAFIWQEMALAFAAGAERVEVYKLRNSADHPESIEPFGLLRADDSRRPAFDAYRAATTYLRDFRGASLERAGELNVVTFDRGTQTTTMLWTTGRADRQARIKAIARDGLLVEPNGQTRTITATQGAYAIDLPGAVCTAGPACTIGGAPRMLVEIGAPDGRTALFAAPPTIAPASTIAAASRARQQPPRVPQGAGFDPETRTVRLETVLATPAAVGTHAAAAPAGPQPTSTVSPTPAPAAPMDPEAPASRTVSGAGLAFWPAGAGFAALGAVALIGLLMTRRRHGRLG